MQQKIQILFTVFTPGYLAVEQKPEEEEKEQQEEEEGPHGLAQGD